MYTLPYLSPDLPARKGSLGSTDGEGQGGAVVRNSLSSSLEEQDREQP